MPETTVSANGSYGIEIAGHAHDNVIVHMQVGTSAEGNKAMGNRLDGASLGSGTRNTRIGGLDPNFLVLVRYNGGNGVTLRSSRAATIAGSIIADNQGYGHRATGRNAGSTVRGTTIAGNALGEIDLTGSTGVGILDRPGRPASSATCTTSTPRKSPTCPTTRRTPPIASDSAPAGCSGAARRTATTRPRTRASGGSGGR